VTTFWIIALAIALVGSALIVVPLMRSFFGGHEGDRHPGITLGTGIAIALILPVAALTLYARWSSWDWAASGAQMSAQEAEQVHSTGEAITSLEARLAAQPDDLEGWQMLARSYMSQEQFGNAARAYQQAVGLAPDDLSLRADYAEALFLSDPAGPAGEAGMMFAELVEQTPENAKVMWYGGFVAFETGQDARGRELWSALLQRNPPAPIRRIIEERLGTSSPMGDTLMAGAQAATPASDGTEAAAEKTSVAEPAPTPAPPTDPDAIQLSVTVSPELAHRLTQAAPLFIFARGASGGPPLAVVRRGSNELPLVIEMSDENAMMQGVQISTMPELQLVARVSLSGSPAAKPGDLFGEVKYSRQDGQQVAIVIDQVVE